MSSQVKNSMERISKMIVAGNSALERKDEEYQQVARSNFLICFY